jgi:tetratricopeptide (TPR) repeat protein
MGFGGLNLLDPRGRRPVRGGSKLTRRAIGDILRSLMRMARPGWTVAVALTVLLALAGAARADKGKDAHRAYDEATAAFGLGRYAEAAEKYEQAFSLRPDPALLYNAAQSYRLAGNKARALELYRNCLRLYPDFPNAEDARTHVASLKKQLEDEQRAAIAPPAARAPAASSPPVMPLPASPPSEAASPRAPAPPAMPPPVLTTPPPPSPPPSAPPLATDTSVPAVSTAPSGDDQRSLTQKPWFWVVVGVAAVAAGTLAIVLATRGTQYPDPTFGNAKGN